jgi:hypothetical protein
MTGKQTTIGLTIAAAGLLGCFVTIASPNDDAAVPYPRGYRLWAHLHSTFIGPKDGAFGKQPCETPCTGGVFYFYANEKAMEGFRTGKFADGSVIADEVLETWGNERGGAKEGPRRGVGVMVKDSKRYGDTGGWGFGRFAGDSQVEASTAEEKRACFACHAPKKDRDYVFTEYRER